MRHTGALNTQMNVTPLLGVLLALTAVMVAVAGSPVRAQNIDMPGCSLGPAVPVEAPPTPILSLTHSEAVIVSVDGASRRSASLAEVKVDVRDRAPWARSVYIRADADVPYARAAQALSELSRAGYTVGLISEDLS